MRVIVRPLPALSMTPSDVLATHLDWLLCELNRAAA